MSEFDVRKIVLHADGSVLDVEMSQRFCDHLRNHFKISDDQDIEDHHIKEYVLRAVENAVTKAESKEHNVEANNE